MKCIVVLIIIMPCILYLLGRQPGLTWNLAREEEADTSLGSFLQWLVLLPSFGKYRSV